jgi:DNA end-binding protein Ku
MGKTLEGRYSMRALWKGAISFGLVNIPVGLYSGTQQKARIDLDLLRDTDQSRIRYKKVAEADGKEVPPEHIVKGYEYEKGQYVILRPEDYERVAIKSNQTIDIREFVNLKDIEPQFFDTPYYLAPEKGGAKAYALLRQVLVETGLAGIAKVVIRPPREHLAVLKPFEDILILETMHFADELRDPGELKPEHAQVGQKELKMARTLVESMTGKWEPGKWHDEYRQSLMKVIEEKIESGGKELPKRREPSKEKPGKVIDLVSLLQQSLGQTQRSNKREVSKRNRTREKAA